MRHSRRAVMAERYKLYAKKNIFNSRYFVRNMQIGLIAVVLMAMIVGAVVLVSSESKEEAKVAEVEVSVKDALFSNSEETKSSKKVTTTEKATERATESTQVVESTEVKEAILAEKVQTELTSTVTEVVSNVAVPEVEMEILVQEEDAFGNRCIAKVEETLNIRSNPSADAEFVGQMNNGAIAKVVGVEGDWVKIKSGDVEGYVMSEYVLTGEEAAQFAKDYVTLRGTVLEDGVNVRAEMSTDSEILVVKDKDDTITVLENPEDEEEDVEISDAESALKVADVPNEKTTEVATEIVVNATTETTTELADANVAKTEKATVEIEWLPVMLEDGKTGYVSAELVHVEELYEIAVSAEELQRRAEEEAARKAAEEAAAAAAAAEAQRREEESQSYEGATTTPVTATESGDLIGTFTITAYCGCKKCSGGSNRTASGTVPTEGRTIAADTSILPFGTQVVIGGVVYTVEDCGSGVRGNHIDIFFATHAKALQFGRRTMKVYRY
ncbi:MAG: SH3 domain-containing protein [Lachnospiraceae bacterium]|nr:SH3 domain-containing protein [Lachnospiraceae bacterium]